MQWQSFPQWSMTLRCMSFSTKILVELVSGVLLGLFSTSMRPCSRWRRMGSSSTAPTGGGRGGGADWYPFLELGQAPRARVCAGYGHLSLVPMRLAPYYGCNDPGVGHHAHPASWHAGLRPTSSCPCPGGGTETCKISDEIDNVLIYCDFVKNQISSLREAPTGRFCHERLNPTATFVFGPPVVNGQFLAVGCQWCRVRSANCP